MNLVKKIKTFILAHKTNLKTAFKVWLFFAILKGVAVILVWFGFATIIHNFRNGASDGVHVYGYSDMNKRPQLNPVGSNSTITMAMLSLICTIAKLKPSIDVIADGADDSKRHVTIIQRAIRDGSVSRNDLNQLVNFGIVLGDAIANLEGTDELRAGVSQTKAELSNYQPELITLLQYVTKRRLKQSKTTKIGDRTLNLHGSTTGEAWKQWQNAISQDQLYNNSSITEQLLHDMVSAPIVGLRELPDSGTQIKLLLKLQDGSQAIFKPMRVSRTEERNSDIYFWNDLERHHAEIAAFHLDRILKFNRVPPTIGRFINITSDIERFASEIFKGTIYISPAGNKCFFGNCEKYCDGAHPVCGNHGDRDVIEGSIATWLPFDNRRAKKRRWKHPWVRTYSRHVQAEWQTNTKYCEVIRRQPPYNRGRRLLDIMDMSIFDYLTGNPDRHSYHTFSAFGNDSSPILYDNGRGFGLIQTDDKLILTPLTQCCLIRHSTLNTLVKMATSRETLGARMRHTLSQDPLSFGPHGPILSDDNLNALDRRLNHVIAEVWECAQSRGLAQVIINDGL